MHSVEHPPYSIAIFSPNDLKAIMDYATDTYYRHYHLYSYLFTPRQLLELKPTPAVLEQPPVLPPLAQGTLQAQLEGDDVPAEPDPPVVVPPTEEELERQQQEEDDKVLEDPKSEMIQTIVAKQLEAIKESFDAELEAKQNEYNDRLQAVGGEDAAK